MKRSEMIAKLDKTLFGDLNIELDNDDIGHIIDTLVGLGMLPPKVEIPQSEEDRLKNGVAWKGRVFANIWDEDIKP